jgi:predicted transcriptional regulator
LKQRQHSKPLQTTATLPTSVCTSNRRALFSELTPARVELLETLRQSGSCSVYLLARTAQRNYSNVHSDISALEKLGLVQRDENDAVFVPFDVVEIRLALHSAA